MKSPVSGFDITEFLAMGGYAFYVWSAYVLAGIVLGGLIWQSLSATCAASRHLAADSNPGRSVDNPARSADTP